MQPIYDQTKKNLTIEWMEPKKSESPSHRFFSKKPIKLQMHPKLADKLIRAYFKGAMPSWIKHYAETHNFEVKQVKYEGKDGWWIAKWAGFEENPFSSPTVKGAVRQFSKMIPFVCEDLRGKVIDNLDIIEQNLSIDPNHFHRYGLYFRPEELNKEGGCLLLEKDVIPERDQEEDEDYRNLIEAHGKLADLVWEITNPLSKELEVSDEDLVNDIELNEKEHEEVLIKESDEIIIDLEEIKVKIPVLEETEEVPFEIIVIEEIEEMPLEIVKEAGMEIEETLVEPETYLSEEVSKTAPVQKLVPLKNDDKKAGAITGQMPLF
ncbi:hypothetical protein [Metabacillus fastidiosus]|uniref:hypothetical protein n=1 Tax=Metabacillus fastidiosus TaxID=1458 RepID=UPI003D2BE882